MTRIAGGTASNVIPETVELGGTVRSFRPDLRTTLRVAIERIVGQVTAAFGATADFRWIEGYAAVINDPHVAGVIREEARHVVGAAGVVEIPPIMAGEDFSSYLTRAPAAFVLVGARNPDVAAAFPLHHAGFTVDEAALPIGVAVLVRGGSHPFPGRNAGGGWWRGPGAGQSWTRAISSQRRSTRTAPPPRRTS